MNREMKQILVNDRARKSVVTLNSIDHVFATVLPSGGDSLRTQTRNALEAVARIMDTEGASGAVVHQAIFVADTEALAMCRQIVREFYGKDLPATSYIPQPPCAGTQVAIEAMGLGRGRELVEIDRHSDQLVITKHHGMTWVYADQAVPRTSAPGVYEKTICSYQLLRRLLPGAGVHFHQVLRTWLYLGGIVDDDGAVQRYRELNRARADVYEHIAFMDDCLPETYDRPAFPASTGIGTNGRSISISALAVASDDEHLLAIPLENPRQTAAYSYAPVYSPTSPKFSRGLALCDGVDTTLFISGTASITQSETRHIGDVAAQTHETLENIAALISETNLSRHGLPGRGATLDNLGVARVYIKRADDYPQVREICEQRLGTVPLTYLVADVCRPDLLVEIEGMAFARKTPNSGPDVPRRRCSGKGQHCSGCAASGERVPYCPDTCPELFMCPNAVLR